MSHNLFLAAHAVLAFTNSVGCCAKVLYVPPVDLRCALTASTVVLAMPAFLNCGIDYL